MKTGTKMRLQLTLIDKRYHEVIGFGICYLLYEIMERWMKINRIRAGLMKRRGALGISCDLKILY